jgi:choline dehydrogenase
VLKDEHGRPVAATPDIQFHVSTLSADMAGGKVHPFSGFTLSICQLRPESKGYVDLFAGPVGRARNAGVLPATELDQRTTIAGVRAAREIANSAAMRPYVKREFKPGRRPTLTRNCWSSAGTTARPSFIRLARQRWEPTTCRWSIHA